LPIADTLKGFFIEDCDLRNGIVDLILAELSVCKKLSTLAIIVANLVELKPNWLSQFPSLEAVSFSGNPIKSLPNGFFNSNLNLKKVYLIAIRISNMNTILKHLSAQKSILEELELDYNSIASIDDQINTFPNLKTLSLSGNLLENKHLTKKTFRGLLKLERIFLGQNLFVKTIPNDAFMSNLNLKTLDLSRNQLSPVPSLGYLSKLELFMFNNQNGKLTELRDYDFDIM
jgi:Leucine-rich repeat (LRR) protein